MSSENPQSRESVFSTRRTPLHGWVPPGQLRTRLFGDADWQVWLDAGVNAEHEASPGRSYLGVGRSRVVTASVERGTVTERILANGLERSIEMTIFEFLRTDISTHRLADNVHVDGTTFQLGWVGWLGYELGAQTAMAPVATSDASVPDACFIFLDRVIEFDHATQTIFALSTAVDDEWGDIVQCAVSDLLSNSSAVQGSDAHGIEGPEPAEINPSFDVRFNQVEYQDHIASCLDEIRAGNAYQLCLTNRIDVAFESAPSPFDVYERLRLANPSHHGGLIVAGGVSLISSSPEVFLSVTSDGRATTKPIKGTRPRSADGAVDAALADELRTNEKERAENLMIVDLMRNDLGRVCEVGSVTVEKLFDVESYASVHQLVSTVGGNLAEGITAVDALAACFPAGSMTGAPKLSAMRILNGLEVGPRGIYSGAFGYLSLDGACDFAMVIRSILLHGTRGYIGTGGGITSGSVPRDEWEETLVKARPLLTALGADLAGTPFELPGANSRGAN